MCVLLFNDVTRHRLSTCSLGVLEVDNLIETNDIHPAQSRRFAHHGGRLPTP